MKRILPLLSLFFSVLVYGQAIVKPNDLISPKTYAEAVDQVIGNLDPKSKELIRDYPKGELLNLRSLITKNSNINYRDKQFMESCANSNGRKYIHFEDIIYYILRGVWNKLNADAAITDFDKIATEAYFPKILTALEKYNQSKNTAFLAQLPDWIYKKNPRNYFEETPKRDAELLALAKKIAARKNTQSYLAVLYLVQYNDDPNEVKQLLQEYYKDDKAMVLLPSYNSKSIFPKQLLFEPKTILSDPNTLEYTLNTISKKEFALKCYGLLYHKNFESDADFKKFMEYSDANYLAYWKYQNTLTVADYQTLMATPQKLLEIVILTGKYFHRNRGNDQLIDYATDDADALVQYFEKNNDPIDLDFPYHISFKDKNFDVESFPLKSVNALVKIADKLSDDEFFKIIDPKSIEAYNSNLKTEDFIEYKYLIGFLLASQPNRLLNNPNKDKVFELCNYYNNKEFISWAVRYYLSEILIQLDAKKAIEIFKKQFPDKPTEGSFTRQGMLKAIIKYDFENNRIFIEEWYWKVHGNSFNHRPKEYELILDLLENKDQETMALHYKIVNDLRYKE